MSSLQKFHRRTNGGAPDIVSPFTSIGSGSNTLGYWLGTSGDGVKKLIVAPKSTEINGYAWGSYGVTRGTTSTTDGLANTNTLFSFGAYAHPAAGYVKGLSTGGYNTWYLPAQDELLTMRSNRSATPFASANAFTTAYYWTSTEVNAGKAVAYDIFSWYPYNNGSGWKSHSTPTIRAVRRD